MAEATDIQEMKPRSPDCLGECAARDGVSVAGDVVDMYRADAAVGANDTPGVQEMVVYQVAKRFVDNEDSASDEATSIVYYALGIGHHTGIIDCFEERLRCPISVFMDVVERATEDAVTVSVEDDFVIEGSDGTVVEKEIAAAGTPSSVLASKLSRALLREETYIDKYDLQPLTEDVDAVLGTEDPYRNVPLDELPAPAQTEVSNPSEWLEEFRMLLDRMMADWDASLILRRRG